MADTASRNSNVVTVLVDCAQAILETRARAKAIRELVQGLGPQNVLTPEAFAGTNSHVGPADVPPLLAALDAIEAVLIDPATAGPTAHLRAIQAFSRGA